MPTLRHGQGDSSHREAERDHDEAQAVGFGISADPMAARKRNSTATPKKIRPI